MLNCFEYILEYFDQNKNIKKMNRYKRYEYLLKIPKSLDNIKYKYIKNTISVEKLEDLSNLDEYNPITF
jgi:hypothetical protein